MVRLPTVIFVHGAGGGSWEYGRWQPVFSAAGFQVIAYDLAPAPGGLSATRFDDYLQQVIASVPLTTTSGSTPDNNTILVGASMGGLLALKAAEQIKPAAIVLVNSVPPAGVGEPRLGKAYPEIVRWANGPLEETRAALFDSDEATIDWAWSRWRDESGTVLNQMAAGILAQRPACPTLVVLSEQDRDIPYQTGMALAVWAGADVLFYQGMSHVGPLLSCRAQEVAQAVMHWMQSRGRDPEKSAN